MVEAVPTRDYAGAAVIFSAAAAFASLIILSGPDLLVASAGLSAAVSSYFLRPIARKLAAHQYFLRPFIMGCAIVLLSHLLLGLIAVPVSELGGLLTDERCRFEVSEALSMSVLLISAGLFVWFITVPIGILAAYCVEVVGWVREDARDRRCRAKAIVLD
jgi:hypothetical protein